MIKQMMVNTLWAKALMFTSYDYTEFSTINSQI